MAVDVNAIKTNIKSILDTANTTGAAFDLSTGLNTRVQRVLKVNPLKIPIQPSLFPYVTCYISNKDIEQVTIAKDMKTGKRMADIRVNLIGAVWEQLTTNINEDEADEQIEVLMENVEEVLRRSFTLNNSVRWSTPRAVSYHALKLDEETHMRVGLLELMTKVEY